MAHCTSILAKRKTNIWPTF